MKTLLTLASVSLMLALAGCASLDSRISKNQAAFDSWPVEVRSAIRAGQVKIGFTPEQVRVALGDPHRVYSRESEEGEAEVWAYFESGPKFSFGVGVGSGGYGGGMGGGVAVSQSRNHLDEAKRIVFENGAVVAIEARSEK